MTVDRRAFWNNVFSSRSESDLSWFEDVPRKSLELIRACDPPLDACIVDIGAGASHLADALLAEGFSNIVVVDIAPATLELVRERLGDRGAAVRFITADVVNWRPAFLVDIWHDRAALHFLTEEADRAAYVDTVRATVRPGGYIIISGFAPSGPERCSGLPVARADPSSLSALMGPEFSLIDSFEADHVTPRDVVQRFVFTRFHRR